ncbi:MAG: cobalt-zinc-cadmium efflux system protein [Chloroflexi bacterium]|nr:MAG: cobalt-zinc-cadmium efflux system protein [Chloroflexota bacterium]
MAQTETTTKEHFLHQRRVGRRALILVLILTTAFMVAEVVGGVVTGSLALMADAGHMANDAFSLSLALGASIFSERRPTQRQSYGHYRAEVLAALVSGFALILVAAFVLYQAAGRIGDAPEIRSGPMLAVALVGLAVNLLALFLLREVQHGSLNIKGAFLHVLGDLLSSVGVVTAAVIMWTTGFFLADAIISMLIAVAILFSAWRLLRQTTNVLMESVPEHIELEEVRSALMRVPGVCEIHDLHVWTLTTGYEAMSAHVLVDDSKGDEDQYNNVLTALGETLKSSFNIDHTTIQLESAALQRTGAGLEEDLLCDD